MRGGDSEGLATTTVKRMAVRRTLVENWGLMENKGGSVKHEKRKQKTTQPARHNRNLVLLACFN